MTDRGLPAGDAAFACPFVAFDDDRDARASGPDHRHRCFAEIRPAPRALAHQEAYCLTTAFTVCPAFQDWARREGARVVSSGQPTPPGPLPVATEAYRPGEPARNPHRDWAAPPPWLEGRMASETPLRRAEAPGSAAGTGGATSTPAAGAPASAASSIGAGLAGGIAARLLGDAGAPIDEVDEGDEAQAAARRSGAPSRAAARRPGWDADEESADDRDDDWRSDDEDDERVAVPRRSSRRPLPAGPGPRRPLPTGRSREDREATPPWEEPRRFEHYPSLRSRRLPSVPGVFLAFGGVLLAALVLFMLPGLLGFGSTSSNASPTPSAGASGTPAASDASGPTDQAGPTPFIYTVQANDTMSKIANKFGVPLQMLLDANKDTIPNPNVLAIGDQVTIPSVNPTTIPNAASSAP